MIGDPHTADRPPAQRTETYTDDVFAKLDAARLVADEQHAAAILITGDLFHVPVPVRVSHALVARWLVWLEQVRSDVVIVPGNHDLAAGRLESLSRQPLGVIAQVRGIFVLSGGRTYAATAAYWGHGQKDRAVIAGVEWAPYAGADSIRELVPKPVDVLLLHAPISREVHAVYRVIDPADLAGAARVVVYGHMHGPEAPYQIGGTWFVNPGALARGALTASDLERTPQVAVIDLDAQQTVRVTYVPLPARPASEVFRIGRATAIRRERTALSAYVEQLRSTAITRVTPEALVAAVGELTADQRVVERARAILAAVSPGG